MSMDHNTAIRITIYDIHTINTTDTGSLVEVWLVRYHKAAHWTASFSYHFSSLRFLPFFEIDQQYVT
jgi:hypothetical protein